MSGGGTRSGRRSKGGASTSTPAGVTYSQFMAMGEQERYDVMDRIIGDKNIKVPNYLDDSITSKVMYALGLNGKPQVVSDAEFDKREGETFYRTVRDGSITASDIINQIKTSDYTQLSNSGGSFWGRALYFGNNFGLSAFYGAHDKNAMIMRVKINPNSKIMTSAELARMSINDNNYSKISKKRNLSYEDSYALYALAKGIDGWREYDTGQLMVLNRRSLITSSKNKKVWNEKDNISYYAWDSAPDA